jgi:hypothetical protein
MKRLAILLACAACGDDDELERYDCGVLAKSVMQRKGTCNLDYDPTGGFGDGCAPTIDAYCSPNGRPDECPIGWSITCRLDDFGNERDCTYGTGTGCEPAGMETVLFSYVQTLDGIDGLGVMVGDGQCEFRPCR